MSDCLRRRIRPASSRRDCQGGHSASNSDCSPQPFSSRRSKLSSSLPPLLVACSSSFFSQLALLCVVFALLFCIHVTVYSASPPGCDLIFAPAAALGVRGASAKSTAHLNKADAAAAADDDGSKFLGGVRKQFGDVIANVKKRRLGQIKGLAVMGDSEAHAAMHHQPTSLQGGEGGRVDSGLVTASAPTAAAHPHSGAHDRHHNHDDDDGAAAAAAAGQEEDALADALPEVFPPFSEEGGDVGRPTAAPLSSITPPLYGARQREGAEEEQQRQQNSLHHHTGDVRQRDEHLRRLVNHENPEEKEEGAEGGGDGDATTTTAAAANAFPQEEGRRPQRRRRRQAAGLSPRKGPLSIEHLLGEGFPNAGNGMPHQQQHADPNRDGDGGDHRRHMMRPEDASGGDGAAAVDLLASVDITFSGFEGLLEGGAASGASSQSSSSSSSSSGSGSESGSGSGSFSGVTGIDIPTTVVPTTTPAPTPPPYMGPCIACPALGLTPAEQLKLNQSNGIAHVIKFPINETADEWGYAAVTYCSVCNTSGGSVYIVKPSVDGELPASIVGVVIGIAAAVGYILALRYCCKKPLKGRDRNGKPLGAGVLEEAEVEGGGGGESMGDGFGMADREAMENFAGNYQQQMMMQMMGGMMGMMNGGGGMGSSRMGSPVMGGGGGAQQRRAAPATAASGGRPPVSGGGAPPPPPRG